jgi:hypothetical protein
MAVLSDSRRTAFLKELSLEREALQKLVGSISLMEIRRLYGRRSRKRIGAVGERRRTRSLSWFSEKSPPYIEKEENPGGDGYRIRPPVCFSRGHSVFVDVPDGQLARRADVCIQGHVLHTFRAFFGNISAGISCASRCFHITPIIIFPTLENSFTAPWSARYSRYASSITILLSDFREAIQSWKTVLCFCLRSELLIPSFSVSKSLGSGPFLSESRIR